MSAVAAGALTAVPRRVAPQPGEVIDRSYPVRFTWNDDPVIGFAGGPAAATLAKVCAVDLGDRVSPDGTAFRSSVAKVVTDVIRDDTAAGLSYLLICDRSFGQYLYDALLDAGAEWGIDAAGSLAE